MDSTNRYAVREGESSKIPFSDVIAGDVISVYEPDGEYVATVFIVRIYPNGSMNVEHYPEILTLAANALGLSEPPYKWNPLFDDGDAFRLASSLNMFAPGHFPDASAYVGSAGFNLDWLAATRYAIVNRARHMALTMKRG